MNHSRRVLGIAVLSAASIGASACEGTVAPEPINLEFNEETAEPVSKFLRVSAPVPQRYMVVLNEDSEERTGMPVWALAEEQAAVYGAEVDHSFDGALTGYVATMSEADAQALAADEDVAWVEEDGELEASDVQTDAVSGLDRIDQRDLPLDGDFGFDVDGTGVTVFVFDTGIRASHVDFGGRVTLGASVVGDGRDASDCDGHGTHVAGTIGSETFGVAKGVNLVAMRVLGCDGRGSTAGIIRAIDLMLDNVTLPAVANMSLGGGRSRALDLAVQRAGDAGVVFAVAAGNENTDACNGSPARSEAAITVGSSTFNDRRSGFSNFGDCVDIFAPGSGIRSTFNTSDRAVATLSGTSMASPHVAGAAALFLQANPQATPAEVQRALVENATTGRLRNVRGSPNALLFTGFIADPGSAPPPDDPPADPEPPPAAEPDPEPEPPAQPPPPPPAAGTPRTGSAAASLAQGRLQRFRSLPVLGGTPVSVRIEGRGDADLYVRFDARPTFQRFDCRPFLNGSNERCVGTVPAGAQRMFIAVHGFRAATYVLTAEWVEP